MDLRLVFCAVLLAVLPDVLVAAEGEEKRKFIFYFNLKP